ncbi:MAG: HAD family hydrolase [Gammaproteobacteria bacterium]|nr:HAD family hydrolase [Gammaproteobacteria bacterium]
MTTAIFDLDNTLLGDDSDYLWGHYLVTIGVLDEAYDLQNQRYLEAYRNGTLDVDEFLQFQLAPLARHAPGQLCQWRAAFLAECIRPLLLPKAMTLVEAHRVMGHNLLIATATNSFITRPIVEYFGIDALIATEPEMLNGRYTGRVDGIPCMGEGKRRKVEAWLAARDLDPGACTFYSDSRNDMPLMKVVGRPVATDPDEMLRRHAWQHGWRIVSLR